MNGLMFPKPEPRVIVKIRKERDRAVLERQCRADVKRRDKGRCVIPGCKEHGSHLHHIKFRSRGGKFHSSNCCLLCVKHHQCVHAALITIEGDANDHLTIHGARELLRIGL